MSRAITYRVEVYVTVPLSDDPDNPDYPTLEGATSSDYKRRQVELPMLACLRRLEHEVTNIELMDFTVEEE